MLIVFGLRNEINTIHQTFIKELNFSIRPTDVGA